MHLEHLSVVFPKEIPYIQHLFPKCDFTAAPQYTSNLKNMDRTLIKMGNVWINQT